MKKVLLLVNISSFHPIHQAADLNKSGKVIIDAFDTDFNTKYPAAELPPADVRHFLLLKKAQNRLLKKINILLSIPHIYCLLLFGGYTHVHISSVSKFDMVLLPVFWLGSVKLVLTIFGSDFVNADTSTRKYLQSLFNASSVISFTNQNFADQFDTYYQKRYSPKLKVQAYGLSSLRDIDAARTTGREIFRNEHNIADGKIAVVCATYGGRNNNQKAILEQLLQMPLIIQQRLHLIIPYTYSGNAAELAELKAMLQDGKYGYTFLTEPLNFADLANLRLVTDILIHLPSSDQFSAAMLETMYAGGLMITGSWLQYQLLDEMNFSYIKISKFDELNAVVLSLLDKGALLEGDKEKNKKAVSYLTALEHQTPKWLELYN